MDASEEGLRISPKYTSSDWNTLSIDTPADWVRAVEIVRDRLEGRFLRFVDSCLPDPFSGFIVLAVDSLLAETIQQFREGETNGTGKSKKYIREFLSGPRFQPDFDEDATTLFYSDIRCGLLHQAEAKEMWLVRRGQPVMLKPVPGGKGYIIDVPRFHAAVRQSLGDYYQELIDPSRGGLRTKLWKKMDQISRVRTARGVVYEASNLS
jgi:hypothetical protein